MHYRQLGKSDLQISRIGFGCMSLTNFTKEAEAVLHHAVDLGINYFDTADLYGQGANELLLGRALKQKRNNLILATKVGNQMRKDGNGWDWNPRKEYILEAIDGSLRRLGTDYVDLYQLHGGTINDPIDETIEAFEQLVASGKIRYYGISSIRPNVIREWTSRSGLVSVMMQYSLLDRRPEESCLALLGENATGLLVRGSLAQGLLVDKPARPYLNYKEDDVAAAARAIGSVTNDQRNPAQAAIQFVLNQQAVSSAIIGIRTMDQLMDAVHAADSAPLSEKEMQLLNSSLQPNFYQEHR